MARPGPIAPTVPTTPKGRRTREQLLEAARVVFDRDGYVNARMADIAAEANLSMGALYRYFANKDSVFEALVTDIHEELFTSSRPTDHRFADAPFEALREANLGFLQHYFDNRDVMRTLVEASAVNEHFRQIWWQMRRRHSDRFVKAFSETYDESTLGNVNLKVASDAMTCMVEQVAYVWYGHEAIYSGSVDLEEAAEVTTRAWFRLFFAPADWNDRDPL